ncbi:ABC transporter permease [Vallicoccus soli]|uniref:ABC transporter permease n=1 Tax=Vallicoccus soli TaxID=2339232 RepID=A0A3A3YVF3_9ACTN|nr:ABC transporter permease [Vallicoccus soli]RJK94204.1 ABC transporter permease [Vallicoccus soli]
MSAPSAPGRPAQPYAAALARAAGGGRPAQLRRVVAAEWVKARSVPSTWAALGSFAAIMVGIAAAITGAADASALTPAERAALEPVAEALSGVFMGQVALGVLGALLVTAEHGSRLVTVTLTAVPQRGALLAGKALLLVALTAPVVLLATSASAVLGLALLDRQGLGLAPTAPGVPAAVLGTCAYLVLVALLGLAAGALLRSSAAAVVVLTVVLFLLPVLVGLLPAGVADAVGPWLPSQAGQAVTQLQERPGYLPPAAGLAVLGAYVAAALAAAAAVTARRDA